MKYQRDAFINKIYEVAKTDQNVFFLSADFGAPSLDRFRVDLPDQFIHLGIAEQNMIDVAIGLAIDGKKVFTYAMAPFISLRCAEQHKLCAMMNLPVINLVAGVGLSYANAGPTHYSTEDYSLFSSFPNAEIYTVSDCHTASQLAEMTLQNPHLCFVRLDRDQCPDLEKFDESFLSRGFRTLGNGKRACVLSHGYMLSQLHQRLSPDLLDHILLVDLIKSSNISKDLSEKLREFSHFIIVDEQLAGSDISQALIPHLPQKTTLSNIESFALKKKFYFQNTGREQLLVEGGLDLKEIIQKIEDIC